MKEEPRAHFFVQSPRTPCKAENVAGVLVDLEIRLRNAECYRLRW